MADTFGIFLEDSVPTLQVLKDVPLFMKGKGNVQNIKKKALGDVSNTVSQKAMNMQHHEKSGKLLANSCSSVQQELSSSCKSVVQTKEIPDESSTTCTHCRLIAESDYDILPKSLRSSEKLMERFTSFCHRLPCSPTSVFKADFDLPDLLTPSEIFMPQDMVPSFDGLEKSPLADVSIPSLDDSDLSDFSF